jgi:hypothetical protein
MDCIAAHVATHEEEGRPNDHGTLPAYTACSQTRLQATCQIKGMRYVGVIEMEVRSQVLRKTTGDC